MTTHSSLLSPRRAVLALCLALVAVVLAVPARADDVPKFKDPLVTEYCQKFSAAVDRLVAAKKAKDRDKALPCIMEVLDLQKKYAGDVAMKVDSSEFDAYHAFMDLQLKRFADAANFDDIK